MSRVLDSEPVVVPLSRAGLAPARQAYRLLYIAFIAAPIIAGLDKFTNFLVQWEQYLTPPVAHALPVSAQALMRAAGIVEIVAGLLVAFRPALGGYVVALWLCGIIVNLLLGAGYYDIALRDFGLLLGALALARLSALFERSQSNPPLDYVRAISE
jgi:hypothetical protein